MDNRPIGVMDSGVGGLSVVQVLKQQLPNETIIFVGDQGHFPYGTRDTANIQQLALSIGEFFKSQDVKLTVIACNTATAAALEILQERMPFPVIGVIEPGAKAALSLPQHHMIGVIATESTTESDAYPKQIRKLDPNCIVISKAAQPLVSIVEHGLTDSPQAQTTVDQELAPFKTSNITSLILGCTHFPFLSSQINHFFNNRVTLVDPAEETVKTVQQQLITNHQLSDQAYGKLTLYSTGDGTALAAAVKKWLTTADESNCCHLDL
ncbi:glutamate racemase [Limosilactobacillus gastricus]|uniref:glutamate racemase n=1 Tax=Limosilactobacillus gastricus TaxID=227942 RepID=UPI0002EB6FA0|nr:glutamate racemase [Limosilactobacillus gastricus]